ncbi:EGF-like repeat and discoidin I-like domain-containing protein 3 isoform X2 [Acropora millepora]|uniref:EGF-like repeat and discoidin I-like domain-containing protein 3 isoform X2 n=1 Tax=Acropora millepora TaxID=45264 RepID=UPI001CF4B6B9|nr:EGF-like repeat and discoidin I-like domain-containing protein 3 isoform X2 [Acropora millepora]
MQAYESFSKLNMDYTIVFVLVFVLIPEIAAWESTLLSSSATSRNNSRLKGLSFKSFQAESVVSCALRCQRVPRCISLNFRKTLSSEPAQQSMGVCEFNEREAVFKSAALQHEEGYVYIQLHNTNAGHDCQLIGCLNGGSCVFNHALRAFRCLCKKPWSGQYCEACPVPLGMESGAIKDSQLSASSEFNKAHGVHFSRLRPKLPTGRPGAGGKPPGQGWKPPRPGGRPPRPGGKRLPNCWVASFNDHNPWLQVDLKNIVAVIGIATQGLVTQYKIQFREMDHQPFKVHKKIGEKSETGLFIWSRLPETALSPR